MDPARDNILQRVRSALRVQAHRPEPPTAAAIWPPIDDLAARFRTEFELLRGEIIPDAEALRTFLGGFKLVATDGSKPVGEGNATAREAELGVTGCECLVARTGTIVVSRQALSVLPPVHLVIARHDQLVAELADAFQLLKQRRRPSALTFITGPSRTADIEKILVMGAHGPKRLVLYLA